MIQEELHKKLRNLRARYEPDLAPDFPAICLVKLFWADDRALNPRLESLQLLADFLSPLYFPPFEHLNDLKIMRGFYSYDMAQLAYTLKITPIQAHYISMLALTYPEVICIENLPTFYVKETKQ